MTVANQTNRTSATGSGAVGQEIPFSFPIKNTSDLLVKKRITATGVETTLVETTNYTVDIEGNTGGTVTTVTAIETTEQIHVIRKSPRTQSLDLVQGGSFNADNVEDALDKNTKLIIESHDQITNKAITFPETDPSLTTELPSAISRASKNLTFDASGNVTASDSVATGSVSFSTFGTNMAEAANALAGKAVINLDHVFDVRDYGATGDGATNDATAISDTIDAAAASGGVVFFPQATYVFDDDDTVPYNVTLQFVPGALLQVETGKVVTIQGTILAGNNQIFSGAGFVDTNQLPGHNNICWYPGSSFNDKWDAMINQWVAGAFVKRTVYIPRVPIGNSAAINYTGTKYAWKLDGTIDIDGKCNNLIVICEGKLFVEAASGVTNAVTISDTSKIEEVFFPLGIQIDCNTEADTGILIEAGSRIIFGGIILINHCVNGIIVNTDTDAVGELLINKIYVGSWTGNAVELTGTSVAAAHCVIKNINAEVSNSATCTVLKIAGRVPNFSIDFISAKKGGGSNNIQYGILMQANLDGAPAYSRANISSAYFDFVGTAIKTEDTTGGTAHKISELNIGPIHASNCTTLATYEYLQRCRIEMIDSDDPVTIASDCEDVTIITLKGVSTLITDSGVRTRINGFGAIAGTRRTPPTTGNWEIGEKVRVMADNKVYLKIQDTAIDVADFILLRTGEVVCNENRVLCNENQVMTN